MTNLSAAGHVPSVPLSHPGASAADPRTHSDPAACGSDASGVPPSEVNSPAVEPSSRRGFYSCAPAPREAVAMKAHKGVSTATREVDEKHLLMLRLRDKRFTSVEIGAVVGMTSGGVRATFQKIDREYYRSEGAA